MTAGHGWIAVATDKRLVRVFAVSGIQRETISLPGPIVCMAAHGQQLLVIYHSGTGRFSQSLYLVSRQRNMLIESIHVSKRNRLQREFAPVVFNNQTVLERDISKYTKIIYSMQKISLHLKKRR